MFTVSQMWVGLIDCLLSYVGRVYGLCLLSDVGGAYRLFTVICG